ncbi:HpcH/HpaI aldolase/citrate lyase family protein [Nocardioides lianchengensis]|uniref:Citrate lyase subunit beta / citryl-CoA lyase n=1 Tax=Nocardioides lianchengensis TaxID=1045774 RepID=A0A1G7A7N3_9ACTN|nr:CoA ester lyase [Nocardioides lianchengensis]NYG13679.1 citrate lyase subunit beta/citryl-CoA lyase [Nocardioides lianchengensis]SDE10938.1 citrate lyase subunit beta / citryl-CoA lyase [Nocardioides lianchengensis]
MLPRSFLYVPADRPDLFDKAAAGPADAIVLDLEDAVPAAGKTAARDAVRRWLPSSPATGAEVWARISPLALDDDLAAVYHPRLAGLLLAGCTPEVLDRVAATTPADLRLVGLVESAAALVALPTMAAHPRLTAFGVGEVDLLGDLRVARTPRTDAVVAQLRTLVVVHSAAAGLEPPVAPTSTDFRDLDAFAESTRLALDLGFRSRTAIHPGQVPVIHDALTPSAEEVAAARDLVRRFDEADGGGTVDASGRFVDAAVVRGARETLSRAR